SPALFPISMFTSSSSSPTPPNKTWKQQLESTRVRAQTSLGPISDAWSRTPDAAKLGLAMVGGSLITFGGIRVYKGFFKRIRNSEQVSSSDFEKKRWIKGVVTSVGDADNFRLYHTPGFGWNWPLKFRRVPSSAKDLKEETLHIRMMGIDAPEAAHFGKPAQPYAEEALEWLRNAVLGKRVPLRWQPLWLNRGFHSDIAVCPSICLKLDGRPFTNKATQNMANGEKTTYYRWKRPHSKPSSECGNEVPKAKPLQSINGDTPG
ncbi:7015_t:CDS:2, partial [Acaulospora colombiana]